MSNDRETKKTETFAMFSVFLWIKDVKVNIRRHYHHRFIFRYNREFDKIAYLIQDTLLPENCQISSKEGVGILYAGAYLLSRLTNSDLYS